MANSLVIEPFTNQAPPLENLQRARQLATRALQMDPLYGEAHAVLAHAYFNLWSWPEAESEFRQALALEPNSAMTHQLYALFLASQDRFNEAIPSIQRAVNLAPTSPLISFSACRIHFHAQRYAEAARFCHETLPIDPARLQSFLLLSRIASLQNNLAQAQEHLSAWSSRRPSPLLSLWQAYYLAAAGESAAARALLARWEQTNSSPSPPPLPYGLAKLKLQDFSSGFAALEQSVQHHLPASVWLKVTPELQPHRHDPRLQKIFAALHAPNPIPPAASPAASPTTSPNLAR
ncbi:tetratricopeptide repeat protein [Nostoc sp. NIES-2111]